VPLPRAWQIPPVPFDPVRARLKLSVVLYSSITSGARRNNARWTRLSCHRYRANEARFQLSLLAYNLGNLWRRVALPKRIDARSLTSLQQRLIKTGGRLAKHARYYWLSLAETHLTRRRFGTMLQRIWRCRCRPGSARTEGAKYEAKGEESEQCLRTRSRDSKRGLSDVQERAVGIPPISLEPVLLRNLLWRG
jgi:hypothetical protein